VAPLLGSVFFDRFGFVFLTFLLTFFFWGRAAKLSSSMLIVKSPSEHTTIQACIMEGISNVVAPILNASGPEGNYSDSALNVAMYYRRYKLSALSA
jgi:hypothetical protein